MTITIKDNGYTAASIQGMINVFNKAAQTLFPGCGIEHFYYGDALSMVGVRLDESHYAHFNITKDRVSLTGYTCSCGDYHKLQLLTYRDECFNGQLMQIAG